jgi:hypothetical protein
MEDISKMKFLYFLFNMRAFDKKSVVPLDYCPTRGVDINELEKTARIRVDRKKRVYLLPMGKLVVLGEESKRRANAG